MTILRQIRDGVGGRSRSQCPEAGFSLVELMISISIGLVIIGAVVALFLATSRNNREMSSASSVIENGRFAIQLLESDVVHAGFWGSFVPGFDDQTSRDVPTDAPTAIPDPCLAYASWDDDYRNNLIGVPIQAYESAAVCGGVLAGLDADSDVLVVRHVETCAAGVGNCEPDTAGRLYFQSALCADELPGRVLGVTGVDAFPWQQRNCSTLAEKRRFVSSIYFVANVPGTAADGLPTLIPTLMRSEFGVDPDGNLAQLAAEPLVEGIEAFRVELGVDNLSETGGAVDYTEEIEWVDPDERVAATNRGDGSPDGSFVRCTTAAPCTVGQLANVTAVRIYVLARSRDPTAGYVDNKTYTLGLAGEVDPPNDGFKRHVYSTTVRLPNVAGRRARPGI